MYKLITEEVYDSIQWSVSSRWGRSGRPPLCGAEQRPGFRRRGPDYTSFPPVLLFSTIAQLNPAQLSSTLHGRDVVMIDELAAADALDCSCSSVVRRAISVRTGGGYKMRAPYTRLAQSMTAFIEPRSSDGPCWCVSDIPSPRPQHVLTFHRSEASMT